MTTSNDIANQALQLIGGNQKSVTGNAPAFDSSTAGQALAQLYLPCVATVTRQFGWDFARTVIALTLSGNPSVIGYAYEYLYPPTAIEVLALVPASANFDANNPLPLNWTVTNTLVSGVQKKVIQANEPSALAVCNNAPAESTWDPLFREAVVRLLASELAMALVARPETAENFLQSGAAFESLAEGRPD